MSRTSRINEKFRRLTESAVVPKLKSFGEVTLIGTPPSPIDDLRKSFEAMPRIGSVETEMVDAMARRMNIDLDNEILHRFNNSGDLVVPGCETAVFRDNPNKGTKEGMRNVIKGVMPVGVIYDEMLEELKDKPNKGKIKIEDIINKYRITNND